MQTNLLTGRFEASSPFLAMRQRPKTEVSDTTWALRAGVGNLALLAPIQMNQTMTKDKSLIWRMRFGLGS